MSGLAEQRRSRSTAWKSSDQASGPYPCIGVLDRGKPAPGLNGFPGAAEKPIEDQAVAHRIAVERLRRTDFAASPRPTSTTRCPGMRIGYLVAVRDREPPKRFRLPHDVIDDQTGSSIGEIRPLDARSRSEQDSAAGRRGGGNASRRLKAPTTPLQGRLQPRGCSLRSSFRSSTRPPAPRRMGWPRSIGQSQCPYLIRSLAWIG